MGLCPLSIVCSQLSVASSALSMVRHPLQRPLRSRESSPLPLGGVRFLVRSGRTIGPQKSGRVSGNSALANRRRTGEVLPRLFTLACSSKSGSPPRRAALQDASRTVDC